MNTISNQSVTSGFHKFGLGVALALMSLSAVAESPNPDNYNLIVIEDRAYGKAIEAGRHEQAITRLENRGSTESKRFSVNTNLCVAYLLAKNTKAAELHCNVAVASQSKKTSSRISWYYDDSQDKAIALSNRGVLRALTGDYEGARIDLEAAVNLDSGLNHPVMNLAKLKTKSLVSSASLL